MIRKADRTNMSATDPTPDQIRERSETIRRQWTPRERARRLGIKRIKWMPPIIAEIELPGYLAGELDSN